MKNSKKNSKKNSEKNRNYLISQFFDPKKLNINLDNLNHKINLSIDLNLNDSFQGMLLSVIFERWRTWCNINYISEWLKKLWYDITNNLGGRETLEQKIYDIYDDWRDSVKLGFIYKFVKKKEWKVIIKENVKVVEILYYIDLAPKDLHNYKII